MTSGQPHRLKNETDSERLVVDYINEYRTSDKNKQLSSTKNLVEQLPDEPMAYVLLGYCYNSLEESDKERASYQIIIDKMPDWSGGYASLGLYYLFSDLKDFDIAEKNFSKTVEIKPNEAMAHINLGDVSRAQNKLEAAASSYSKAIELKGTIPVSHTKLGHANSLLGKYQEARDN